MPARVGVGVAAYLVAALSEEFDRPILVHRYPSAVKAFYMKENPADPRTVLCDDCLAPEGYGEIIGGSVREENNEFLIERLRKELGDVLWYVAALCTTAGIDMGEVVMTDVRMSWSMTLVAPHAKCAGTPPSSTGCSHRSRRIEASRTGSGSRRRSRARRASSTRARSQPPHRGSRR